jgi:ankyrin repeat protein
MLMEKIFEALYKGDSQQILKLIREGINIEVTDRGGRSPLINAVLQKNVEIVKILINNGADINLQDKDGRSALHFAAQEYMVDISRILLDKNAEVDIKDHDGNTPLSDAVFWSRGRGELIKLLLSYGADKNLKNNHNVSPLELAYNIGNYNVKQFFEEDSSSMENKQTIPPPFQGSANKSANHEIPFMEHPSGEYETSLEAITSAMERLFKLEKWDRWITFGGQGQGSREDSYYCVDVQMLNHTFRIGAEEVNVEEIIDFADLDKNLKVEYDKKKGEITLPEATPNQQARFLDALFRKHFGIKPFDDEDDYAVGAEW